MKRCSACGELKAPADFYPKKAKCRRCVMKRVMAYIAKHPEKKSLWGRICTQRLRLEVLSHYSGGQPRCECCAEAELGFLTIDHPKGDGAADRRRGLRASVLYRHLKRAGFPTGYRVLCFNCNCARGATGKCPHELAREATA